MGRKKIVISVATLGLLSAAIIFLLPSIRGIGIRGGVSIPGSGGSSVTKPETDTSGVAAEGIRTFASEAEFVRYFANVSGAFFGLGSSDMAFPATSSMTAEKSSRSLANPSSSDSLSGKVSSATPRVSETNVRTEGMDEPDIVKTDGGYIYYSREARYSYRGGPEPMPLMMSPDMPVPPVSAGTEKIGILPPSYQSDAKTDIFSVSDGDAVSLLGSIGKSGETLLYGETLILFESSGRSIAGYDISDRKNPQEKWIMKVGDGSGILEARKSGDRLYVVERTVVGGDHPCPIRPMAVGTTVSEIACTDIYRPELSSGADAVFTALYVDPENGTVGDAVSFVGSSGQSVIYMSSDSLFVTYRKSADPVGFLLGFFRENEGLLSAGFLSRLERLSGYDIGADAKNMELERLLQDEMLGKDGDERLRLENEMTNRMSGYAGKHLRELGSTGIVKITLRDFAVRSAGSVPGTLLNDFSIDESGDDLRVATTVGGRDGTYLPMFPSQDLKSENDIYILDGNLKKKGELSGLGSGERIYSARFIGDRGYLVTFRETDPFYVLDLSDPTDPKKAGELKIPGYSSYLHPLDGHLVLGIGREENKVKLSLFDVADPVDPKEISKYLLDEYWSEATDNHRAFLADPVHKAFFVPGSKGGYVISYEGNALSLKRSVSGQGIRRAVFIGDTLHVIGDAAIVSLDENTWEKKGETDISR